MTIVLSNNLTYKQKELIVNTIFEVQEGMPFVANYYEPIYSLFLENTNQVKMPVKAIGDDIMSANEKITKKVKDFVVANGDVLENILQNKATRKISTSNSSINIIEEYSLKFLKALNNSEKVYSIGAFNEEESQYVEKISLTSIANYDLIKSELENFFEKLTNKEFKLEVIEKVEPEKKLHIISDEDIERAEKDNSDVKEESNSEKVSGKSIYDGLAQQALEDALYNLANDYRDYTQAA